MFWILVSLGIGWWLGRNWDMVKKMYHDKVKSKQNSSGNATKID